MRVERHFFKAIDSPTHCFTFDTVPHTVSITTNRPDDIRINELVIWFDANDHSTNNVIKTGCCNCKTGYSQITLTYDTQVANYEATLHPHVERVQAGKKMYNKVVFSPYSNIGDLSKENMDTVYYHYEFTFMGQNDPCKEKEVKESKPSRERKHGKGEKPSHQG